MGRLFLVLIRQSSTRLSPGWRTAGVPPQNIVVWDREERLLKVAGFALEERRIPPDVE